MRFRIVPRRTKHDRAHAEAMRQFWAQGLHKTGHRTGVLIFAAEAERYAEIVADAGINEKVTPEVWDRAVKALTSAIKHGRPGDGFVAAIAECGEVLAAHFPPGAMKQNELPDKLVEM
jgi:putative membrane protein